MRIPIVSGIYTDNELNVRTSYPVNFHPVPSQNGVSDSYLKPFPGITYSSDLSDIDRGGVSWRDVHYRVIGSKLVVVDNKGLITALGDVGSGTDLVKFTYGFDRLAIVSAGNLYYYYNNSVTKVDDPDLGYVIDVQWIENFFMVTDGKDILQMDRDDPTVLSPFSFGAAELDPDDVQGLMRLRNELIVIGRNTIEYFDFVGGVDFAFSVIDGAQVMRGSLGVNSFCEFMGKIAFLGGSNAEPPGIYIAQNANSVKISTQEIDDLLLKQSERDLSTFLIESVSIKNHKFLILHLSDRTIVYDHASSEALSNPVWFVLSGSSSSTYSEYSGKNFLWVNDKWWCSRVVNNNTAQKSLGFLDESHARQWGKDCF